MGKGFFKLETTTSVDDFSFSRLLKTTGTTRERHGNEPGTTRERHGNDIIVPAKFKDCIVNTFVASVVSIFSYGQTIACCMTWRIGSRVVYSKYFCSICSINIFLWTNYLCCMTWRIGSRVVYSKYFCSICTINIFLWTNYLCCMTWRIGSRVV